MLILNFKLLKLKIIKNFKVKKRKNIISQNINQNTIITIIETINKINKKPTNTTKEKAITTKRNNIINLKTNTITIHLLLHITTLHTCFLKETTFPIICHLCHPTHTHHHIYTKDLQDLQDLQDLLDPIPMEICLWCHQCTCLHLTIKWETQIKCVIHLFLHHNLCISDKSHQ